jgi:hypothetical protein
LQAPWTVGGRAVGDARLAVHVLFERLVIHWLQAAAVAAVARQLASAGTQSGESSAVPSRAACTAAAAST